jgi:hypothetical protein
MKLHKIKYFHEITLKDVILLDATKSANVLKRYWFVPLWLCRKELEALAKQIFDAIGGKTVEDLEDQFERMHSYRKIQVLELLYMAVKIEIGIKPRIIAWKIMLEKDFKESPRLASVLDEVKKITGIEIQNPEDLNTLADYIQHKIDKHAEMFPQKDQEEGEESSLSKVIYSIFNFMGEDYKEDMRLITFLTMKEMAESRIKQYKTQEDGIE